MGIIFTHDVAGNIAKVEDIEDDYQTAYTYTYNNNIPVSATLSPASRGRFFLVYPTIQRLKMLKLALVYPPNLAVYRQFRPVGNWVESHKTLTGIAFRPIISSLVFLEQVNDK